ncbi:hypothetical protein Tco_0380990 [Tanacetum coccineum]
MNNYKNDGPRSSKAKHLADLIINHALATHPTIPRRIDEPYYNLKDDDPVQMMFATGKPVDAIAMIILNDLLTEKIKQTEAYKAYDDAYNGVEVPTTQPLPVVSAPGINRILSAPSSPKPKRTPKKKREKVVGESSEPKKNFKIITKKPDPMAPNPTTAEIEKNHMTVTEQVKAALDYEVDKMVEGEEEVDVGFVDSLILSQEDPDTRIDPRIQKENPKEKNDDDNDDDDDDKDDYNVDVLIRRKRTGSLEIKEQEKQTLIATPPRSPRFELSLDKAPTTKLTDTNVLMSDVSSHSSLQRAKHLKRVLAKVTKHRNNMIKTMEKNFVHQCNVENLCVKIVESLDKEVPPMVVERTDQHVALSSTCHRLTAAAAGNLHEWVGFKKISLTGFHNCTSRSHYRSVLKQATWISQVTYRRACLMLALKGFPSSL